MKILSKCDHRKVGSEQHRCLRVNGLFGGKKDNSEKGDDAPSKVSQAYLLLWSVVSMSVNFHMFLCSTFLSTYILPHLHTLY